MSQDVRDTLPVWVRYAEYIGGGSDKYYELRVDLTDQGAFQMTARWGRRPDTGTGQTKVYDVTRSMGSATAHAEALFREKIKKGYRVAERPFAADRGVARDNTPEPDPYDDEDY